MMTWRCWNALKRPPHSHPLFRRAAAESLEPVERWRGRLMTALLSGQIWLWAFMFIVDMRLLLLMTLSGTLYGLVSAAEVAGHIRAERDRGMFDLLCTTPGGGIHILWTLCAAALHRQQTLERIIALEFWVIRWILFVPLVVSGQIIARSLLDIQESLTITWIAAWAIIIYLDIVQGMVIGLLCGGILALEAGANGRSRLLGGAVFLLLHLASGGLALFLGIVVAPWLLSILGLAEAIAFLAPVVLVISFTLLREAVIGALHRALLKALNALPYELHDSLTSAESYAAPRDTRTPYDEHQTLASA